MHSHPVNRSYFFPVLVKLQLFSSPYSQDGLIIFRHWNVVGTDGIISSRIPRPPALAFLENGTGRHLLNSLVSIIHN